jgi:hypothetical protein
MTCPERLIGHLVATLFGHLVAEKRSGQKNQLARRKSIHAITKLSELCGGARLASERLVQ